MYSTGETLQILARQMGEVNVSSRAELEAKLTPLLCLILRTGRGHPTLLQWVRLTLPAVRSNGPVDPKETAQHLARLLCLQLLRSVRAQRDTHIKRHTLGVS
jgi:hypothetical protein